MIGSTHNHSTGSDGKLTPEEVIKKAISLGWDYVYFTDHYLAPIDFKSKYYSAFFNDGYIEEVKELKKKYKDKIEVCFGVEVGWFKGRVDWIKKELKKQDYDYVIGSIHEVYEYDGKRVPVELGEEDVLGEIDKFDGVENYVKEYYNQIKLLIKSKLFDSVGHLDYIKIYNKKLKFFSEKDDWYKKEILECLDLMKINGTVLEINHGGLRRCKEQFPSTWILKEANKRNIPITLGLDSHWGKHYDNNSMKELINVAKKVGYDSVVRFKDRKIIEEKI